MRMDIYCVKCIISQIVELIKLMGIDREGEEIIMREVLKRLGSESYDTTSPELAEKIYDLVREISGIDDPYKEIKTQENKRAEALVRPIEENLSELSLGEVLKLSVIGNSMDYGTEVRFNVEEEREKLMEEILAPEILKEFEEELKEGENLLVIGDNAGEIVFDRLLLRFIKEKYNVGIKYAVRGGPIINDATLEDAEKAGIDKYAEVITTGQKIAGLVLERASKEIIRSFKKSSLVLSKGQGNFETLEEKRLDVYFLFRVKCPVVASYLKKRVGEMVFLRR